jgi:hypothetical protein
MQKVRGFGKERGQSLHTGDIEVRKDVCCLLVTGSWFLFFPLIFVTAYCLLIAAAPIFALFFASVFAFFPFSSSFMN